MAEAQALNKLHSKHKPLVALLPYAVWQEQHGQPEMFDMLLHVARAPGTLMFTWRCVKHFVVELLPKATPHTTVFISPSNVWESIFVREDFVQRWAAATSVIPHTEEAAQCVVDVLLQVVSYSFFTPPITTSIWLWLMRQPMLPPICRGRARGSRLTVVRMVRGLENIDILKSYLLLVWSEWDALYYDGFEEMCDSVREDFCGIGMGRHWGDLVQRLDHVLGRLDQGLGYLKQYKPDLNEDQVRNMQDQYRILREILIGVNIEAVARTSYPTIILSRMLIQAGMHRISRNIHVRASSPKPIIPRLEPSTSYIPLHRFVCTRSLILTSIRHAPPHTFPLLIVLIKRALFLRFLRWVTNRDHISPPFLLIHIIVK